MTHSTLLKAYQLKYCKVDVWCNNTSYRSGKHLTSDMKLESHTQDKHLDKVFVTTTYPTGHTCTGSREVNEQNIKEARSQGYKGSDEYVVDKSLIEHELLHSLIAETFFDRVSYVMATESGLEYYPTWDRYLEEAMVLGFQSWANTFTWNRAVDALEFYSTEWSVHKFQAKWSEMQKEIEDILIYVVLTMEVYK